LVINQFDGYGDMACGLVAGMHAGASFEELKDAAGASYSAKGGIQPRKLAKTYRKVYGDQNVQEHNSQNYSEALEQLYLALMAGNIVIVDILVHWDKEKGCYVWGDGPNSVAHFARVIGIDFQKGVIKLDNTLGGDPWEIPLDKFDYAWYNAEKRAILKPEFYDIIGYWWVAITPRGTPPPQPY
jgi:hypothetical protein